MRILIIGGTGIISSPMVRQVLDAGHDVTVLNRNRTATELPIGARRIVEDRRDFRSFQRTLQRERFDAVVDMVCYKPDEAENLVDTLRGQVGHLIVCSTVDVYQKPAGRYPVSESEPFGHSCWEYASNKVWCEKILWQASEEGAFPLTIIRPAHTYGDGSGFLSTLGWGTALADRMLKGKPIVVHGDGQSLWTSCHAEDVARAFVGALFNERAYGRAYHAASDEWLTWNQIHQAIAEAIGAPKPNLVHIPIDTLVKMTDRAWISLVNFQFNNIFDNSAAHRDLGFRTTISLKEGMCRNYKALVAQNRVENSDEDPHEDQVVEAWHRMETAFTRVDSGNP